MNSHRILAGYGYAACVALALGVAACDRGAPRTTSGQTPRTSPTPPPPPAQPDNTSRNTRDRDTGTATPADQGESEADRRISAEVRRVLMSHATLSADAQNCKIITRDGVVTLRGPVADQAEKDLVEQTARGVAGVTSVINELEAKQ